MDALRQLGEHWKSLPRKKRGVVALVALCTLTLFVGITVSRTGRKLVQVAVPPELLREPRQLKQKLAALGVTDYRLDKQQLLVGESHVAICQKNLKVEQPVTATWAEEWDRANQQVSQFSGSRERDTAKEIARAKFVSRLLSELPDIEHADVLWDEDETAGWRSTRKGRATVYLKPKPDCTVTPEIVKAVRMAVAGSKKHLHPDDIIVMDMTNMVSFDATALPSVPWETRAQTQVHSQILKSESLELHLASDDSSREDFPPQRTFPRTPQTRPQVGSSVRTAEFDEEALPSAPSRRRNHPFAKEPRPEPNISPLATPLATNTVQKLPAASIALRPPAVKLMKPISIDEVVEEVDFQSKALKRPIVHHAEAVKDWDTLDAEENESEILQTGGIDEEWEPKPRLSRPPAPSDRTSLQEPRLSRKELPQKPARERESLLPNENSGSFENSHGPHIELGLEGVEEFSASTTKKQSRKKLPSAVKVELADPSEKELSFTSEPLVDEDFVSETEPKPWQWELNLGPETFRHLVWGALGGMAALLMGMVLNARRLDRLDEADLANSADRHSTAAESESTHKDEEDLPTSLKFPPRTVDFDELLNLEPQALRLVYAEFSTATWVAALSGASQAVKRWVFAALLSDEAHKLSQQLETNPPSRLRDIEQSQQQILQRLSDIPSRNLRRAA